jgi:hypothetical protein
MVAMALHELATNAVKYGALSNGDGRVSIAWEQFQAHRLKLIWQESGGPEVNPPKQQGFGSYLKSRSRRGIACPRRVNMDRPAPVSFAADVAVLRMPRHVPSTFRVFGGSLS